MGFSAFESSSQKEFHQEKVKPQMSSYDQNQPQIVYCSGCYLMKYVNQY